MSIRQILALALALALLGAAPATAATIDGYPDGSKPSTNEIKPTDIGKKGIQFYMYCDDGTNSCLPLQSGTVEVSVNGGARVACSVGYVAGDQCGYYKAPFDATVPVANSFTVYYADEFPANATVDVYLSNVTGAGGATGCTSATPDCALEFETSGATSGHVATNVELVLDTSGSMSSAAIPGLPLSASCFNPPSGQTVTRICALQLAARRFLAIYQGNASFYDELAAITFNGAAAGNPALLKGVEQPTFTQLGQMIDQLTPGGGTAIGQGLNLANSASGLGGASEQKWVLLFTDGEQNVAPLVSVSSNQVQVGGTPYPGIKVCPITTGPQTAPGYSLLQSLADASCAGANAFIAGGSAAQFDAFLNSAFTQFLTTALQGDKYEISRDVTGSVATDNQVTFPVNSDDQSFQVILTAAPVVERPTYTLIAPDGTEVKVSPRFARGASVAAIQLPLLIDRKAVPAGGQWRLIFDEKSFGKWPAYHLIVVNDSPSIATSLRPLGNDIGTGEPLVLQARLTENGKPITNATVTVDITGPNYGLGNVLSTNKNIGDFPGMEGDNPGSPGQRKLLGLAANPKNYKLFSAGDLGTLRLNYCQVGLLRNIRFCARTTRLNPRIAPGGAYVASFAHAALEGHYGFTFHAIGTTANGEDFERTWKATLFVRPKASAAKTPITVEALVRAPNGGFAATLRVEPHDALGNYIGPGYDGALTFVAKESTFPFVRDNLDGSYEFEVSTPPDDGKLVLQALGLDVKTIDLAAVRSGSRL